jgi:hypothetical protein
MRDLARQNRVLFEMLGLFIQCNDRGVLGCEHRSKGNSAFGTEEYELILFHHDIVRFPIDLAARL